MRNSKQPEILSLFILSICYGITMAQNSPCGDWEPYKDEKCIKIIDETRTYDDAIKTCQQQENSSSLISIHSLEEQEFFSNLLFKTHKVVDAVWIGAKYSINKFKWVDDSDVSFSNWAEGSPSNTANKACVQMTSDGPSMGKWADEPCNKKNLVVCQKMQTWSLSRLQKALLDTRKQLENIKNFTDYLFANKWSHFKAFSDLNNNRKALIFPMTKSSNIYYKLEEAKEICKKNNASLVSIESYEKQLIVESFLFQLPSKHLSHWIGGYKGSSGSFKWMNNGNEFSYSNWNPGSPIGGFNYTYIYIPHNTSDAAFGKWYSTTISEVNNVFCEISFNF